jgi:hypothetical protein
VIPLTERADVYRTQAQPAKGPNVRGNARIFQAIPCQIVPMSSFDRQQAYSLEATHVIWMPRWCELVKEDEIHSGRREDPFGDQLTYVYVVNGRRRFRIGLQHRAYYCTERE